MYMISTSILAYGLQGPQIGFRGRIQVGLREGGVPLCETGNVSAAL